MLPRRPFVVLMYSRQTDGQKYCFPSELLLDGPRVGHPLQTSGVGRGSRPPRGGRPQSLATEHGLSPLTLPGGLEALKSSSQTAPHPGCQGTRTPELGRPWTVSPKLCQWLSPVFISSSGLWAGHAIRREGDGGAPVLAFPAAPEKLAGLLGCAWAWVGIAPWQFQGTRGTEYLL